MIRSQSISNKLLFVIAASCAILMQGCATPTQRAKQAEGKRDRAMQATSRKEWKKTLANAPTVNAPIYRELRATNLEGEMVLVSREVVGHVAYPDMSAADAPAPASSQRQAPQQQDTSNEKPIQE
jgi:hypothetical protein